MMTRYRLYTGPTRVEHYAYALRFRGYKVLEGTEHVYFDSRISDRFAMFLALKLEGVGIADLCIIKQQQPTKLASARGEKLMNVQLFYAMGPNCYGIAKTKEQAIKYARQCWPHHVMGGPVRSKYFSVWQTDAPEIHVSEIDGSISVEAPYKLEKIQTSTLADNRKKLATEIASGPTNGR